MALRSLKALRRLHIEQQWDVRRRARATPLRAGFRPYLQTLQCARTRVSLMQGPLRCTPQALTHPPRVRRAQVTTASVIAAARACGVTELRLGQLGAACHAADTSDWCGAR